MISGPTLSQYARFNAGFIPVGSTVPRLPAGVYELAFSLEGMWLNPKEVAVDKLIELEGSPSTEVMREIERFRKLKEKFRRLGVLHKRGFLLHGPPGTGKSSTVNLVSARVVEEDGLVVIMGPRANPAALSSMLSAVRKVEPDRFITVVMEDFDNVIENYGEADVLSMLDGQDSINGIVFLATTNYLEKLPARIIDRPSRFDRVIEVGPPSADSRVRYLERFSEFLGADGVRTIAEHTGGISLAHIKEVLISHVCFEVPIEEAARRVRRMSENVVRPDDDDDKDEEGWEESGN